jgi:hypothetical protein
MHNPFYAEWILARFIKPSRAASIVGDLLEANEQRGTSRFWLSFAGILISLTWRRPVAFVASALLGLFSLAALINPIHGTDVYSPLPPEIWVPIFMVLSSLGVLLWMTAPYTAIRYGFRDSFTRLSAAFCGLVTTFIFWWWIPAVAVTCIALFFSLLVHSVVSARRRRALIALGIALAFGYGGGLLTYYLATKYFLPYFPFWLPLLAVAILTTACSRMHRLLAGRDQRCKEVQPTL